MKGTTRTVVTVDGLAASGKSALAARLATRLGFRHLNSGLLYRAVAALAMSRGIALDDEQGVGALVHDFPLGLIYTPAGGVVVTLGDEHNKADLSLEEVSRGASVVARYPQVREKLLAAQREAFLPDGIVAEGRDMGTVVFPDATTKFFVVASVDVRAERRFRQLTESGQHPVLEDIKRDLQERDERDATREVAPMKPAEGALVIDNSKSQLEEVVEQMAQRVLEHRE